MTTSHLGHILWSRRKSEVPPTFIQRDFFPSCFEWPILTISSSLQRAQAKEESLCLDLKLSDQGPPRKQPCCVHSRGRTVLSQEKSELIKGLNEDRELQQECRRRAHPELKLRYRHWQRERDTFLYRDAICLGQRKNDSA